MDDRGLVLDIATPRAFEPLLPHRRFKGGRGGRGGAKSHFFAGLTVEEMVSGHTRVACVREVQNSIKDSVKQLIEDKISKAHWVDTETGKRYPVASDFKITEREIVCPRTDSLAIFRGLQNHTATSIKSLEGFNRGWYEEAQSLSKRSLELATPTFRADGTEQLFSWNPDLTMTEAKDSGDPVDRFFAENIETMQTPSGPFGFRKPGEGDPDFICVHVNFDANPFFPDSLRRDMERDRLRDPDKYGHIWLGGYRKNSEARVFRNWRVERFDAPPAGTILHAGADWGFTQDPTVLILCFIVGRTLYIWREVWEIGCGVDRRGALFDKIDPEWSALKARDPNWTSLARRLAIVADSSEPQTIDFMQRNGFPRMRGAVKGPGSVEEGVQFLQGYDIVIHPDCRHAIDEFTLYSFLVDKKTGEITNVLEDKKNHTIDPTRYALESVRRAVTGHREELNI